MKIDNVVLASAHTPHGTAWFLQNWRHHVNLRCRHPVNLKGDIWHNLILAITWGWKQSGAEVESEVGGGNGAEQSLPPGIQVFLTDRTSYKRTYKKNWVS